jgi:hypothetical protein
VTSGFNDWVACLAGSVSPDAKELLRQVFDEHGPVPAEQVDQIGREHQLAWARVALALIGQDIAATTSLQAPPFEYRDEHGSVRLAFWGQDAPSPVYGFSQAVVIVEVADFIQGEVMEDLHAAWPQCRYHHAGLHPSLASNRAAWLCRCGGHVVAAIGKLSLASTEIASTRTSAVPSTNAPTSANVCV